MGRAFVVVIWCEEGVPLSCMDWACWLMLAVFEEVWEIAVIVEICDRPAMRVRVNVSLSGICD